MRYDQAMRCDQAMCCDALPQTTEAPQMTLQMAAGALMMMFSFCACIGIVALVLMRGYTRRMDAFYQQNVSLGQQFDALGQKGDEKMQEIGSLKTQIHDLKQTMENMKAFITQMTKTTNVQQNSAMFAEAEGVRGGEAEDRRQALAEDGQPDGMRSLEELMREATESLEDHVFVSPKRKKTKKKKTNTDPSPAPTTPSPAGPITSEAIEIDGYVDEDGNTVQITTLLDTDPDAQDGAIVQIEDPRLGFASQFSCVPSCKVSECKPCDTGAVVAPAVVSRQ